MVEAVYVRAELHRRSGRADQAMEDYSRVIKTDNTHDEALLSRAALLRQAGKRTEALSDLNAAHALDSQLVPVLLARAAIYYEMDQDTLALLDCNRLLRIDTTRASVWAMRGEVFLSLGYPEYSLNDYGVALKLDPEHTASYFGRGKVYEAIRRFDKAIEDYQQYLKRGRNDADVFIRLAQNYVWLGGHAAEALDALERALALKPGNTKALLDRGRLYSTMNEHRKALADFSAVIAKDSLNGDAWYLRGSAYGTLSQLDTAAARSLLDSAVSDLTNAARLDPKDPNIHYNRGFYRASMKNYRQAVDDFTSAITLDKKHAKSYFNRGFAYKMIDEYKLAYRDFKMYVSLRGDQDGMLRKVRGLVKEMGYRVDF
jgi:tetratricopeptide (TPR) repeat protein